MSKKILPTPEELRQLLRYEPDTGKLYWKERPRSMFASDRAFKSINANISGKEALTSPNNMGYKRGNVLGITVRAHRAAWAIHYGEWPDGFLDHINGNPGDNRIENLRIATQTQNMWNLRPSKISRSELKGASWCKQTGMWRSKIKLNGKSVHLGRFATEEAAHAAYCAAAKKHHGEFARTE